MLVSSIKTMSFSYMVEQKNNNRPTRRFLTLLMFISYLIGIPRRFCSFRILSPQSSMNILFNLHYKLVAILSCRNIIKIIREIKLHTLYTSFTPKKLHWCYLKSATLISKLQAHVLSKFIK